MAGHVFPSGNRHFQVACRKTTFDRGRERFSNRPSEEWYPTPGRNEGFFASLKDDRITGDLAFKADRASHPQSDRRGSGSEFPEIREPIRR